LVALGPDRNAIGDKPFLCHGIHSFTGCVRIRTALPLTGQFLDELDYGLDPTRHCHIAPVLTGNFRSLVEAVQRRGVRVTVVSTISTQPPMVAAELRRQADVFLDIVELQPKIGRDPAERAAREAREPRDRHTPQFLQSPTAPQPAGAGAPLDDDDDFED
jgi:hypothetical protein